LVVRVVGGWWLVVAIRRIQASFRTSDYPRGYAASQEVSTMPRLMIPNLDIRISTALVLAVGLLIAPDHALAQNVERRPWSELVVVVGHEIALSLPDGYVEGEALAVTDEGLEIDVAKTSNARVYPKGQTTIPRSRVSVIRLRKSDDRAPRVASATIGQAAIMGGLFGLGSRGGLRTSLRGVGVQIGAAAAGAALGRRLDNRKVETLIRVVPEPGVAPARPAERRPPCRVEPDDAWDSIYSLRPAGYRVVNTGADAHVDEHDSDDRRTPGKPVSRCGDR
jgi:hypothetical protein